VEFDEFQILGGLNRYSPTPPTPPSNQSSPPPVLRLCRKIMHIAKANQEPRVDCSEILGDELFYRMATTAPTLTPQIFVQNLFRMSFRVCHHNPTQHQYTEYQHHGNITHGEIRGSSPRASTPPRLLSASSRRNGALRVSN